jgi:hypothetical protein
MDDSARRATAGRPQRCGNHPERLVKITDNSTRYLKLNGGEGWIRTSVRLRGQIYSLLPLTTRPPLHRGQAGAPHGGAAMLCQRVPRRWIAARTLRFVSCGLRPVTLLGETGAGEGNRTLVVSLEGFCSTIELHPHFQRLSCSQNDFFTIVFTVRHRSSPNCTSIFPWSTGVRS